jgi:hypothetical protein
MDHRREVEARHETANGLGCLTGGAGLYRSSNAQAERSIGPPRPPGASLAVATPPAGISGPPETIWSRFRPPGPEGSGRARCHGACTVAHIASTIAAPVAALCPDGVPPTGATSTPHSIEGRVHGEVLRGGRRRFGGCFVAARSATIAMLGPTGGWGVRSSSQVPLVPGGGLGLRRGGRGLLTGAVVQQLPRLVDPGGAGLLAPAA